MLCGSVNLSEGGFNGLFCNVCTYLLKHSHHFRESSVVSSKGSICRIIYHVMEGYVSIT